MIWQLRGEGGIPEWQGIRLEQQVRAAALAQENQASTAETLLALDAWNRDEIRAEECQEITARTTALLREGDADAALNCYEQDPTPPAMFGGGATLRQAFERHLDLGQQEEFRKMTGEVAKAEVLKKVSGGGYLQGDEQAAEDHAPEERGVGARCFCVSDGRRAKVSSGGSGWGL